MSVDSLLPLHSSLFCSGACWGGGDYVCVDSLLPLHSSLFNVLVSLCWGGGERLCECWCLRGRGVLYTCVSVLHPSVCLYIQTVPYVQ